MPPWHADPQLGKFTNDRSLSTEDRETLLAWIDSGTPKGDDKDLPPPRKYPEGWHDRQAGRGVRRCRGRSTVPAETPQGRHAVPVLHRADRLQGGSLGGARPRPGRAPPRWCITSSCSSCRRARSSGPTRPGSVLCGMAPGDMPLILPPGFAKKIPAGARLVFQMHYTPNGKAQTDHSSIGLIFAKKPPKHRVLTKPIHNGRFITRSSSIPAGRGQLSRSSRATPSAQDAPHHRLHAAHAPARQGLPLRGDRIPTARRRRCCRCRVTTSTGRASIALAKPLPMPKGTKLHCVAHFDNSAKNPNNPDPTQERVLGRSDLGRDDDRLDRLFEWMTQCRKRL